MDESNAMVEKSNHELKHQLGISDDIIISKFSNDFSLKLLSPLVRLKKGLNLTLPELVSRSRAQENFGRPVVEDGQDLDCFREDCGVEARHGTTNNDGLDLGQSILHEETLEDTCNESEPLQPELKSSEAVKVNDTHIRTENVADKQVVQVKRKRGRPPKICKLIGGTVTKSTSSNKKPHIQSIVFPPRKPGRPRNNGIPSHSNAQKVNQTAVPISHLSGATKSRRNIPCKNPKRGLTALKDPIVRDYPLRRLFHSTSKDTVLSRRFPGYANVLGQVPRNSSAHSKKGNSTSGIGKTSQRTVEDTQCIVGELSEVKDISQDHIESKEEIVDNHRSKLCGDPGDTCISVDQRVSIHMTTGSQEETCERVPSTISPTKCNLTCMKEKANAPKRSQYMSKLVRCHSVERLPSLPICVDPTTKIKKWEPFSRCCGEHVSETGNVYDFTDFTNESLSEPTSPLTNKQQRKRGRPPKRKESDAVGTKQVPTKRVQSRRGLSLRKYCRNKSEMIPSRNVDSLEIVHGEGEPQKKRKCGRPRKHRTNKLPSQKNCQEETQQLHHVQKPEMLHQEGGRVGSDAEKEAEFIDLPLQQERLVEDKLLETDRNSNPFYVPKSVECGQQKKDVSLLHNTQPNAVRDDSDRMSSAVWTPSWKDKSVLEFQGGSGQVTCLTPPGSNECLSIISGDEYPQTLEEPNIQKACHIPSNINSSSPAHDSVSKGITSSPSSDPGVPHIHQGATITDGSQDLFERIGSRSPSVLQEKNSDNMCGTEQNNKSITHVSQGNSQDIIIVEDDSIQEYDGLSQVRIAKTVTLSKDELSSSCTQSEDMEAIQTDANSMTSSNDVPVKVVESSSTVPRKERENIFQALRGGLNSQSSNSDRDLDQSGSNNLTPLDDWNQEMMSVTDPEIPQLEAYGGGDHGSYASHNSPHSVDSDTLPILEKQAFHDTCLDDDDEFEYENPSDVTSEFNKLSDNIPEQDYSHNWPKESSPSGSDVDTIIADEPVHQDLQHEATGIAEDEDEFEFETPEESDTTAVNDQSSEEHPPESPIVISDSLNAKQEYIDEDRNTVNTPNKMAERQTESELQCDDEPCENSFPVVGISPNHMECAESLQSRSPCSNSNTGSVEVQDCMSSQSNNPDGVPITACKDNTEKPSGNSNNMFVSQRALHKTPSKDEEPADIINIQNDQETNSITPNSDITSEQNDRSDVPEEIVVQEIVQEGTHSQTFPEESNDEPPTTEGSDRRSNLPECNKESSEKPNTSQEMSGEHFQSDTPVVAAKTRDEAHCSVTEDVNGQCQESLPVADGEEPSDPTDNNRCSPEAVNEEKSAHSKLCDVEDSEEYKASTSVHEGDTAPNGQYTEKELSRGTTDLQEVCSRKEKLTNEVADGSENSLDKLGSGDSVHRASPEEIDEVHHPVMQCEGTEMQEERNKVDLHKVQEVMPDQCPETIETSSKDIDNESRSTSQDTEEELSINGTVVELQHSDTKAKPPRLPLCKATSEDTLESKKAGESTSILQKNEDCSEVIDVQDTSEELQSTLSASPDVKELCTISIDKTVGVTDLTKHNEQQEPEELDNTVKKNDSLLSKDLQDDSGLTDPQETLQQNQMADAIQQSNSSELNSDEQKAQTHENSENNNSQPCSPKEEGTADDQSADPEETAKPDQSQKESATEHLGQDCPTKSVRRDPTLLHESANNHTQPNGLCESLADNADTSQDGSNSKDVNSSSEVPQSSEQLIDLINEKKQTDRDGYVYLGVSTSDGTIDMLSIACEETIGGYDEDAMSTTSSGGATIAYPLSDGEDWNVQDEHIENEVAQLAVGKSSTLQDTPDLSTAGLHGKDVEHSSSSTSCKWTVKFTKAKKRKRSRDRHHAKRKRKSNRKHKESKRKSKEQQDKSHLEKPLVTDADVMVESKSNDTATKQQDKRHLEKPLVPDADVMVDSKSDGTATKLPEKQDLKQENNLPSQLQEVAIDKEPTGRIVDKQLTENEITEKLEKQKSTQEIHLGSNTSCQLPNPKSPPYHFTQIHESNAAETIAQFKMRNPISTENLRKRPSDDVYKEKELLSRSTEAEIDVTTGIEDSIVIVDDDPNTLSASQESHNTSVPSVVKNSMSHFHASVPSGFLPRTQHVTSPLGYMTNPQREVRNILHTAQSVAEKVNPGAKPTPYIPQDKATFFGTPRKNRNQRRPPLNDQHSAVPYPGNYYLPPSQQSTQLLQQQHPSPLIQLRNPYLNQSGTCNELKQHLLRKRKLAAPDLQNQMHHQPQSQSADPDQGYLPQQNPKLPNPVIHPSERDIAFHQLAQLRMQSQIKRDKQSTNAANRNNAPLPFHQGQMYPEHFLHSSQRDLPVQTITNHSGAQGISNMSVGLGHRDSERLQYPDGRVATAGTFSPPIVEDLTRKSMNLQQVRNISEDSRVGYAISPVHHPMGYAPDIPVYTATGPKEQVLAVYADGYAPVLQNEIPPHMNLQQNLQPAGKSIPTTKQPQSNPGKLPAKAHVDQDKMLDILRQLHGGNGTTSIQNVPVIQDYMGSQTSSIPFVEYPHILETRRPNEIPIMNRQPTHTTNPAIHQTLNKSIEGYSSSAAMTEFANQRDNLVNSQYLLYNPHMMQNNQELTSTAIDLKNTTPRTPTPRMLSRTPTPKSCTPSTTYASDNSTNMAHQPTSELDRASLSRTSTPRSHCTPSSTPHYISDSTLPGPTEFQRSQMPHNNFTPEEDMPLDLTCKVRPKVEQKRVSPLDLSCRQRTCDDMSQEQHAAQVLGEVYEESRVQDNLSRSRSDHSGSDISEAYGNGAQASGSQCHVQAEIAHPSDTFTTLEPGQDFSSGQAGYISHQDLNVPRQVLNTDCHASNLRHHGESTEAATYVLESGQSSVQEQYATREANVYIYRAGQPHVFSELLHSGLTSEGPGLKIAKTYNMYVNPPTTIAPSIPFIDLTSTPKEMLMIGELGKSSVEVHHRQEQVPDESDAKIPTNSKDQHLNVTHHLRRTRSDETEVKRSSGNSPKTTRASPVVVFESNNQPDVSYISHTNISKSVSTSNMVITSTESNLQAEENLEQLKSYISQNLQSVSDMSQCPKKRFKRAHEASMKQSGVLTPSKMPAVRTGGAVTEPTASPCPPVPRKRGRPRGSSKKALQVSQPEVPVNQQCKFCEYETTSRQEMKNHVNEIHFEKYRTKAASDKSSNITTNYEVCRAEDPEKCDKLPDEYRAPVTPQMGLDALGSKVLSLTPSKDDMLRTGTDYCHHCDVHFPDTSSLAAHQRTHHQSEKYGFGCRLCDYSDSSPGPLVVHINKVHSKQLKEGPCPFLNCSRIFATVKEVKEHLNDHWIVKQYACKICGIRYQVFSSLKAHLDRHKQDLPNMCKVCTLSFKTPGTLLRHQKLKGHLPKP